MTQRPKKAQSFIGWAFILTKFDLRTFKMQTLSFSTIILFIYD